jgi:copper chaperone
MISTRLEITGMHCMGCVRTVTNALKRVAGVKEVDVSLSENSAQVEFDTEQTSLEELYKTIKEAGYEVAV